jgi:hypothetical protein
MLKLNAIMNIVLDVFQLIIPNIMTKLIVHFVENNYLMKME